MSELLQIATGTLPVAFLFSLTATIPMLISEISLGVM